jgi:hypothetical protein
MDLRSWKWIKNQTSKKLVVIKRLVVYMQWIEVENLLPWMVVGLEILEWNIVSLFTLTTTKINV